MAETFRKLAQTQVGTSPASVYTVPTATQTIIKHIRAVNTTSFTASIGLFHDGTTAANRILPDVPLDAGEWLEWDGLILLEASDTLAAVASAAASITLTVYGIEIS